MATKRRIQTVALIPAFLWTCEECGRDNFERAITVSPESIRPEDLPEMIGENAETVQDWLHHGGEGAFVTAPLNVRCRHCETAFDTTTD